jgi:hypothetical protein
MGRGLSPLQQWIVQEVQTRGRLSYDEIRREYFGWETKDIRRRPYYRPLVRYDVDPKTYNRVNATLSRTVKRLLRRGLVQDVHKGLRTLQTPEERQAALDEIRAFEAMFASRRTAGQGNG